MNHRFIQLLAADDSERGATMVEYGIVVALIAIVSILVVSTLGGDAFALFDGAQSAFNPSGPVTPTP